MNHSLIERARNRSDGLRICIDARIGTNSLTGGHFVILGLVYGLAQLKDGHEKYFMLTSQSDEEKLRPFAGTAFQVLYSQDVAEPPFWKRGLKAVPGLRNTWNHLRNRYGASKPQIFYPAPKSDGTIERAGIDVMHFTLQYAFTTAVPYVYQPHDLQHLHYPEFFTEATFQERERVYRKFCAGADLIFTMTSWGKQDLISNYAIPDHRIAVVPWAPLPRPVPSEEQVQRTVAQYRLPSRFLLFPAHAWPHKNHLNLITAVDILRRKGLFVNVVCVGGAGEFYPTIQRAIQEFNITEQFLMLGYVSDVDLSALYRLCSALVFPSKFEGWGLPVMEALSLGVPVATSRIPPIVEQVGGAALLFDPSDPSDIAEKIGALWCDVHLRQRLAAAGRNRAEPFTWQNTARLFRAHYRSISGVSLSEEDRSLLNGEAGIRFHLQSGAGASEVSLASAKCSS